jgi:hypothetical protein
MNLKKLLLISSLMLFPVPALAHDAADWILNGRYKDFTGSLCCGPHDCRKADRSEIIKHSNGIEIVGHGFLPYRVDPNKEDGHHDSIDSDWWFCIFTQDTEYAKKGQVRCVFHPLFAGS